jgi:LysM repeat protein
VLHIVLGLIACIVIARPLPLYAGVFASITDRIKVVFLDTPVEKNEDQTLSTSQTMDLFKPMVMDGTTTERPDEGGSSSQESLQAVSGPMRVSTEEIDFPTTDTVSVYEVKQGDTIADVAKLFNVSVNTIIWANNLPSRTITKGDTLIILPITGIKHVVKKGETVTAIAKKYKADAQDIAIYNGTSVDATLAVGDTIIVPDGEIEAIQSPKPKSKTKTSRILNSYTYSAPSGFLVRPIVGGRKSQGLHGHNGIDLAAAPGTPVLAAATGRIIVAKLGGYNGGYGNMIIIAHDKGIQTVYAHLRAVYVSQGQEVTQGQTIGELGNTGRSTGPHLHFEVRGAKNPF